MKKIRVRKELSIFIWFYFAIDMLIDLIFFKYISIPESYHFILQVILGLICGYLIGYNFVYDNGWIDDMKRFKKRKVK